ncbi:alpha/beta fold hydrolase [Nocardia sp. NPDC058499]|uniref:alpha/beta fold hydrolase n=1 Tax=Nocardia sp. NPDC058499 TaxID=3346530 RepID=UPI003663E3E6
MILHPDLRLTALPIADGRYLAVSRLGPQTGPATIVYLHSPFTSPNYWSPLTTYLHTRLDGRITQLTYHQRTANQHPGSGFAGTSTTGADDLDTVLTQAKGAVVLVAHSAAARLMLSWIEKYPRPARTVAGLVLLNGALEFPDTPINPAWRVQDELLAHFYRPPRNTGRPWPESDGLLAERLHISIAAWVAATYGTAALTDTTLSVWRCIPTWILTGALDPLVPPHHCRALADQVWADYDCLADTGHSLPYVEPRQASQPILAALEVAYRTHLHDGGQPW